MDHNHHHHDQQENFNAMYGRGFDGAEFDEDHTFDDDMLAHLEDLFPGAAMLPNNHMDAPLVFEFSTPGAIGSELQNGSTGTRQVQPESE